MGLHKVFKVVPKRSRAINGETLTPTMEVIVTTRTYTGNPFNNGGPDVIETYKRLYGFDYKKCGCTPMDFDFYPLD